MIYNVSDRSLRKVRQKKPHGMNAIRMYMNSSKRMNLTQ